MVNFLVKEPFDIPDQETLLTKRNSSTLIASASSVTLAVGAFANRDVRFSWNAGHGAVPVYVGRATRKLLKEAFNPKNLHNLAGVYEQQEAREDAGLIVFRERVRLFSNKGAINKIEKF